MHAALETVNWQNGVFNIRQGQRKTTPLLVFLLVVLYKKYFFFVFFLLCEQMFYFEHHPNAYPKTPFLRRHFDCMMVESA